MARKSKMANANAEADALNRAGLKVIHANQKAGEIKKEKLKDPETKAATMAWLFSGPENTDPSPLAD